MKFAIFLKIHVPGSTEIGQKLRFDIFLKIQVYGDWAKTRFDIFLEIHVPASTKNEV